MKSERLELKPNSLHETRGGSNRLSSVELVKLGYVYWHSVNISNPPVPEQKSQYEQLISNHPKGGEYEYYVFVNYSSEGSNFEAYDQDKYDLIEKPVKLCLMIGSGSMFVPINFKSNEIVIPEKALLEALPQP